MNDIKKEEYQNQIENLILSSQEDRKKKYFSYKLPKNLLKNIKLDSDDESWIFDYCKHITTKKINVKIYKKTLILDFLFFLICLIIFSIDICLWTIEISEKSWLILLIILSIIWFISILSFNFFQKIRFFSKKRKANLIDYSHEYLLCKKILSDNDFKEKTSTKKIVDNCLNNMFEFIDDDLFNNLENYKKNKINKNNILIFEIFIIFFLIFYFIGFLNFIFVPIFIGQYVKLFI